MAWLKVWAVIDIASSVFKSGKWLWEQMKDDADKAIEKEFKKHIAEYTQQLLIKFKKEIDQKTIIYICWSLIGILLLVLPLSKPMYYSILSLMTIFFMYIMITSFQSLKRLVYLINNFESYVSQVIKTKMQEAKQESWRVALGLWLSRRNFKDFENLVIASIVRELLQLVKNNKIVLCIRAFAYIVALLLFREALTHIIKYTTFLI